MNTVIILLAALLGLPLAIFFIWRLSKSDIASGITIVILSFLLFGSRIALMNPTITYYQRWAVLGLFSITALFVVLANKHLGNAVHLLSRPTNLCFISLWLWALLGVCLNSTWHISANRLIGLFCYLTLFLLLIPSITTRDGKWIEKVFIHLGWVFGIALVLSFAALPFFGSSIFVFPRFLGIFSGVANFAFVTLLSVPIYIYLWIRYKHIKWLIFLILAVSAMALAGARLVIGGTLVAAPVVLLRGRVIDKNKAIIVLCFISALIVFLLGTYWESITTSRKVIVYVLHNPRSPDTYRIPQWRILVRGIPESPVLGHGIGTYPTTSDPFIMAQLRVRGHSTYLALLYELGIIGFFFFIFGYLGAVWLAWKEARKGRECPDWVVLWILVVWLITITTGSVFVGAGYFIEPIIWLLVGWLGSRYTFWGIGVRSDVKSSG